MHNGPHSAGEWTKNRISSMWFPISHNNAPITVYICSLVWVFFWVEMLGSIWEAGHGGFKNSVWPRWRDFLFFSSIFSNEVPSELRRHGEDMFKHEVHSFDDLPSELHCYEKDKSNRTEAQLISKFIFKFTISPLETNRSANPTPDTSWAKKLRLVPTNVR